MASDPGAPADFDDAPADTGFDWWLGPRVWAPAGALLVAIIVALAAYVVFRDSGEAASPVQACTPGEPGCELRQEVHWHADVAIYIRGERLDLGEERILEHFQPNPNIHFHPPDFNVVHVHREQSTWDELFSSFGITLRKGCLTLPDETQYCSNEQETLKFYVNGVRVDAIHFEDVFDLERVLISYGPAEDPSIPAQLAAVSDEACIASGLCADREPPEGAPTEPCSGATCQ